MTNHIHILFKSGKKGISTVMRKLLTWYAIYYNRKHKRTGHLFENRYKSILCDEDNYLLVKNISKKWTLPIRDWKSAMNHFTILFEGRMPVL